MIVGTVLAAVGRRAVAFDGVVSSHMPGGLGVRWVLRVTGDAVQAMPAVPVTVDGVRMYAGWAVARTVADGSGAWGYDEPGRRLASGYVPVAEGIITAGSGIHEVRALDADRHPSHRGRRDAGPRGRRGRGSASAVNLHTMAEGFANANEGAMLATSRLNGQFGGSQGRGGRGGGGGRV